MGDHYRICVFCSSSDAIPRIYLKVAVELGNLIAKNNWDLVFGGGNVGGMGKISETVSLYNRKVIGIIPDFMIQAGISTKFTSELIITKNMRDRKMKMESISDGFCILPGGYGTIEEMMEVITLKQLGIHNKPIVIFNINNFFDDLISMFNKIYREHFAKKVFSTLYYITSDLQDGIDYLKNYNPVVIPSKWY